MSKLPQTQDPLLSLGPECVQLCKVGMLKNIYISAERASTRL